MRRAAACLTLLTLATAPGAASAHNPQLATFTLHERAEGLWLEAATAQVAIEAALKAHDPDLDMPAIGLPGVKAETLRYLRRHVHVEALPAEVTLAFAGGGVRLGGHETRARLLMATPPPGTFALRIQIDAFREDGAQSNLLRLRPPRAGRARVLLGDANAFTVVLPTAGPAADRLRPACQLIEAARASLGGLAPSAPAACGPGHSARTIQPRRGQPRPRRRR